MRLIVSTLAAFALATASFAQSVHMRVSQSGQPLGTAVLTQTLRPDGTKALKIVVTMKGPGGSLTITEASTYDRAGRALTKELTTVHNGSTTQVKATIDGSGANVAMTQGSTKKSKLVPLPKGATTTDDSENWFVRVRPKVGTAVKAHNFNLSGMVWREGVTTYVGDKTIAVGSKKINGHILRAQEGEDRSDVVVDDKGMPLQIVDNRGLRMERI